MPSTLPIGELCTLNSDFSALVSAARLASSRARKGPAGPTGVGSRGGGLKGGWGGRTVAVLRDT